MHKLRDIMSTDIAHLSPDDNLFEAATMMRDENVGMIPVCENGQLKGIITDRDIVTRGIAEKKPNSSTLHDIMSSQLVYGTPEMSVDEAAQKMAEAQIRRLPIVDQNQLIGVVSLGDLAVRSPYQNEASDALSEISETHNPHTSNDL
ncbi:CBS domain-containing protein [Shimazuella sp. AN120528]|uniref:CBS domain-containing protein n=1 Tax=Shimazuella soli TaxID=1892854 RepID=UPI001F0FB308|nr:CBS domain-containing protein [Shimazuella soli]MCH5583596.1 CBS domain-containing protein [Shimazuella soli]